MLHLNYFTTREDWRDELVTTANVVAYIRAIGRSPVVKVIAILSIDSGNFLDGQQAATAHVAIAAAHGPTSGEEPTDKYRVYDRAKVARTKRCMDLAVESSEHLVIHKGDWDVLDDERFWTALPAATPQQYIVSDFRVPPYSSHMISWRQVGSKRVKSSKPMGYEAFNGYQFVVINGLVLLQGTD